MQFLFPTFLFALGAIAIPIIIHLFYFRRFKKVYFTNVKFLKEVKEETSARQKLRNLLVLLMRCLAIAALVLAFAQPFLPTGQDVKTGDKAISVFIDNSFSMSSLSQDVPLIEMAKSRAREVINAYPVEDRFQVLTNDFEGRHQRLVGKEEALGLIDEIKVSPSVKNLSKVLTRQQQATNSGKAENKIAYVISDFQKNVTNFASYTDTLMDINLIPLQSVAENNISIDSAWFDAPMQLVNQTNPLMVKVRNLGKEDATNVRLTVRLDGEVKPVGTLSIPAGRSVVDTVNVSVLKTGWHKGELEITDYPVQFDDKYYFTFKVEEEINVLSINETGQNKFVTAAFAGLPFFKLTNQQSRNIDYSKLGEYELIILNDLVSVSSGLGFELEQYVENGGNAVVFPAANANAGAYKSFLSGFPANEYQAYESGEKEVGTINQEEFIFSDVFEGRRANMRLPVTQGNFSMTKFGSRGEERLMTYRDGNTFLGKYKHGSGHLYVCAAPLNEDVSNLVRSGEVFIPMLYKMAIASAKNNSIAYTIGKDEVITTQAQSSGAEKVYKIGGKNGEFIPEQRTVSSKVFLGIHNQISESGYYNLFLNQNDKLDAYGFNYDRKESQLDYFNTADLEAQASSKMSIIDAGSNIDFGTLIGERSRGIVLWRWCLIAALLFLGIEVLLLRFMGKK